ncbi:hypothetical protein EHZ19_05180 [Paraburkholderia bannensis]|nr:hypothetical protein EHZ19_05180 [Paraburkholderia bannensis]RQN41089.1 hypothetical protein EHZ25_02310 [Paraburkholderia tropica]
MQPCRSPRYATRAKHRFFRGPKRKTPPARGFVTYLNSNGFFRRSRRPHGPGARIHPRNQA